MDFVDEEHVALFEIGQQRREIAGFGDNRTGGRAEIDAEFLRHDLRKRRLAEAGRADEEHMIECLAAVLRRLDEDLQVGARFRLASEVVQRLWPQGGIDVLAALFRRQQSVLVAHRALIPLSAREGNRITATIP